MKKFIFLTTFICLCACAFAQVDSKTAREYFEVPGGVQNVDKKVLKNCAPQAFPYIALKFRTASVSVEVEGPKNDASTVRTYAMLEGVDSLLFQEITNEFAKIFETKLKEVGVAMVDIAKIKESKLYKDRMADPEQATRNFNYQKTGTADVYTQDHLPLWYYPVGGMKFAKYMNETGGGCAFLRLTIDFVEFNTAVSKEYNYYSTTTNFSTRAYPVVKVTAPPFVEGSTMTMATHPEMGGGLTMYNPKNYFGVLFNQLKPFVAPYESFTKVYDDKIPEFANKKRRGFAGAVEMGTFILEAKRESYKAAALKALTQYADCVAATIKSYNEEKK